jgi:hypothetical protein
VDRIQRNFEPLQRQVELWRKTQITDDTAKLIFYSAFIDGKLEAPRTLLPEVHRLYFEPQYPEFAARTMSSLSNEFTSAFKKLDPVPQFKRRPSWEAFWHSCPANSRSPLGLYRPGGDPDFLTHYAPVSACMPHLFAVHLKRNLGGQIQIKSGCEQLHVPFAENLKACYRRESARPSRLYKNIEGAGGTARPLNLRRKNLSLHGCYMIARYSLQVQSSLGIGCRPCLVAES